MVLQNVNTNSNWIQAEWNCAFIMQWPNIVFATRAILSSFVNPEVRVGGRGTGSQVVDLVTKPAEQEMLAIQGESKWFKCKTKVVFYTKTNKVVITLHKYCGLPYDYESMSKALGKFMDSIELRMYAAK